MSKPTTRKQRKAKLAKTGRRTRARGDFGRSVCDLPPTRWSAKHATKVAFGIAGLVLLAVIIVALL